MSTPTVYPTGTTIYYPKKCWNGYTIFQGRQTGPVLVDMNGHTVRLWKGLHGFPVKLLPGGQVIGSLGMRNPQYSYQDYTDLVQVDWEGNVVWKFNQYEFVEDPGREGVWMARQAPRLSEGGQPRRVLCSGNGTVGGQRQHPRTGTQKSVQPGHQR